MGIEGVNHAWRRDLGLMEKRLCAIGQSDGQGVWLNMRRRKIQGLEVQRGRMTDRFPDFFPQEEEEEEKEEEEEEEEKEEVIEEPQEEVIEEGQSPRRGRNMLMIMMEEETEGMGR
ncbi:hypothetical protein SK128_004678 [Halocaridina rubra]|uniref:Uncharacterized protein n=1 Tax=Halocaridina rubra TaxID=373956 RepID=A0AAN8XKB1_HALRR